MCVEGVATISESGKAVGLDEMSVKGTSGGGDADADADADAVDNDAEETEALP